MVRSHLIALQRVRFDNLLQSPGLLRVCLSLSLSLSLSDTHTHTHTLAPPMINLISTLAVSLGSTLISPSPDLLVMRRGESETVIKC